MAASPVVLVTGSTDGIGQEIAKSLAERGAHVIVHGRDPDRVAETAQRLRTRGGEPCAAEVADLASLDEVRSLAHRVLHHHHRLDVLINNAGVFSRQLAATRDGYELTFGVNHLAHFLLSHLVLPLLAESPHGGRVINVASGVHAGASAADLERVARTGARAAAAEGHHDGYQAYAVSKLANVLFTAELARRLRDTTITVNSLHPGVVTTKLLRAGFGRSGADSLAEGARMPVHLALDAEVASVSGAYFVRGRVVPPSPLAIDPIVTAGFYELSCRLVGIPGLQPAGEEAAGAEQARS